MRKSSPSSRTSAPPALRRLALAVAGLLAAPAALAGVSISSDPLLTAVGVAPNVFFVLDDSGSMQWERMPGDIMRGTTTGRSGNAHGYLFPLPVENGITTLGTYNGTASSNYDDEMPDFDDGTVDNVRYRSSQINAVFYNPLVDYKPWLTYSGTVNTPYFTGLGDGNVDPTAAPYNPARTGVGSLDLTVEQTQSAEWYGNAPCSDTGLKRSCPFYPVTFFQYVGTATTRAALLAAPITDFRKYQIRNGKGWVSTPGGAQAEVTSFVWPGGKTRTVAEELQNFANWFSYYRSRALAAKGGASLAFAEIGEKFRVGFTTINSPGGSNLLQTPITGGFETDNRKNWFNKMLGTPIPANGTPLRSALKWAGDYYAGNKGVNPWNPAGEAECRQSFTILTTDGYWSDETVSIASKDNQDGPTHTNDLGQTATGYKAAAPHSDTHGTVTLADIANYYWKNDLQTSVKNKVSSKRDPAYWQHMTTFTLSFGVEGTLDQSVDPFVTAPVWPNPSLGDPQKIDDLWHAAINGWGKFVAAQDPESFKKGLVDALTEIGEVSASAASLAGNTTSIAAGSTVFQGKYVGNLWSGDLVAWALNTDGSVVSVAKWSASEQMPSPTARRIYTRVGGVTKEFLASQVSLLDNGVEEQKLVNFIRGDQSAESALAGGFRIRPDGVLGDIVNSSPAFVGAPPDRGYGRSQIAGAGSYNGFRAAKKLRKPIVYVGANDGMLHAFDAATGVELFAYIPSELLPRLTNLSKQDYAHEFFVDGSVVAEEVYDGANWRTILIVALGRGGKTVFALDVTDPGASSPPTFELLWEFTHSDLGNVLGVPLVTPLNNGKWGVVLGNGYNGASDKAHLFLVDALTGSVMKSIDTDTRTSNGMAGAGGWDDDGDGDVDYLYAGDLFGQLWKFDVSAASTNDWTTANSTTPMFVATNAGGTRQAITAPPIVGSHPDTGERWVFFGTGKFVSDADRSDTGKQTWYGLRDVQTAIARADLVERLITEEGVRSDAGKDELGGDITVVKGTYRLISDVGDAAGGGALVSTSGTYLKQGWYIDLLVGGNSGTPTGERMLVRNTLLKDILLGETLIPNNTACGSLGDGWLLAVNPWLGGRPKDDFFDTNVDGKVDKLDHIKDQTVSGWKLGNGGIPYLQQCDDGYCVTTTSTAGDKPPETTHAKTGMVRGRLSWRELLRD